MVLDFILESRQIRGMRAFGHTILTATQSERGALKVTLECTCGKIFATRYCVLHDEEKEHKAQQLAYANGRLEAARHIAGVEELLNTLQGKEPCVA